MSSLDQVELTLSELLVIIDAVIIMHHFQHPWYDERRIAGKQIRRQKYMLANHEDENVWCNPDPSYVLASKRSGRARISAPRDRAIVLSERWQKTRSFVKLFVQNGQFWQYKYRWIWESKSRQRRESEEQSTTNLRRWNDQDLRRYLSLTFIYSVSLLVDVWWKLKSYYCVWPSLFNSMIWSSVFFLSVIPSFCSSCYKITFGAINASLTYSQTLLNTRHSACLEKASVLSLCSIIYLSNFCSFSKL